jgi:hypothetical protein
MSKIEVDNVVPQSGTNINLGESGDTVTVPAGVTLDTTNSTVTLPDGSVTNAKLANSAITINGSSVSLGGSTTIETGTSWQSTIVTGTTLTAVAGNGYWIDTTSNACTVTLPASASVGDTIEFTDYARTWGTNAVTINQNSLNFQGYTSPNPVYNSNGQHVTIVYSGATQGWIPTVDDDVTNEVPQTVDIDFLVVAGGGGGGNYGASGGGGAGGLRTSYGATSGGGSSAETAYTSVPEGTVITVTVGAGASAPPAGTDQAQGSSGSNSSISGSGLTTITSAGGGGGGGNSGHKLVLLAVLVVAVETQMVVEILAVQELLIKVILEEMVVHQVEMMVHNVEVEAVVLLHLVALELILHKVVLEEMVLQYQ